MKVSVIIPTHNRWPTVKGAIESVLAQPVAGIDEIECIVVDDGSSDRTHEHIAALYPEVTCLINTPNREKSYARNRGAKAASGDVLCFLDSDDRLAPNSLAKRAGVFLDGFQGVVYAATQRPGKSARQAVDDFRSATTGGYSLQHYLQKPGTLSNNCFMLKKAHFLAIGGYEESLTNMEDMQLFLRLLSRYDARFLPEVSNIVNRSPQSARSDYAKIIHQYPGFSSSLLKDDQVIARLSAAEQCKIRQLDNREYLGALYHTGQWKAYCEAFTAIRRQATDQLPRGSRAIKRYGIARIKALFA